MKIVADTNVLVRAVVQDHAAQARAAAKVLAGADMIAISLPSVCEFVWVLRKVYRFRVADIAAAIRALLATANVETDRQGAEALPLDLDTRSAHHDACHGFTLSFARAR